MTAMTMASNNKTPITTPTMRPVSDPSDPGSPETIGGLPVDCSISMKNKKINNIKRVYAAGMCS